jgi:hypothetical protein
MESRCFLPSPPTPLPKGAGGKPFSLREKGGDEGNEVKCHADA